MSINADKKPKIALNDIPAIFGIRSVGQLGADITHMLKKSGEGFQFGASTLGFFRPDIGVPTYLGKYPRNRLAPVFHCFDRIGGGRYFSQRVTRKTITDFRGRHLGYDEHDGIDFACPVGTTLTAAAPGHVVMIRDNWLRGGITVAVDHGNGLLTQYTHCWQPLVSLGQLVTRGEPVALSGSAGVDMVISFPCVSPHIHFMVWHQGVPVDPYLADGEEDRTGTWVERNQPGHQPILAEPVPEYSAVNEAEVMRLVNNCNNEKIRKELHQLNGNLHYLAAYLEDAVHHDRHAWNETIPLGTLRPRQHGVTKIWLPLSKTRYDGALLADDWLGIDYWQ